MSFATIGELDYAVLFLLLVILKRQQPSNGFTMVPNIFKRYSEVEGGIRLYEPHSYSMEDWQAGPTNELVDQYSRVLLTKDQRGTCYTTVFHPNVNAITATLAKSGFFESGVFTCDYDINEIAPNDGSICFDLENGWKKGSPGENFNQLLHGLKSGGCKLLVKEA